MWTAKTVGEGGVEREIVVDAELKEDYISGSVLVCGRGTTM